MNNFTDPNKLKNPETSLEKVWNKLDHVPNKIFGRSKNDLDSFMRNATKSATLIAITAASFYLIYMAVSIIIVKEAEPLQQLGPMGDFFGGILNPFFGFIGLMALLYTLRLNQKELNQATKQMRKSAKAAKLQVKQDEIQHLLDDLVSEIDRVLLTRTKIKITEEKIVDITIGQLLSHEDTCELMGSTDNNPELFTSELTALLNKFILLEQLCKKHKKITKSITTSHFYSERYIFEMWGLLCRQQFHKYITKDEECEMRKVFIFALYSENALGERTEKLNQLKKLFSI